ncbi:VOC family protein [Streptomyces physcomitrii]|uniref:Glyoxalase n=1 Tax=Streptomyces physcomitrii TaxID=2724184 RepID=A0ABX1H818_9ACTN|nr:VOC family protein [Streptomyces physcomitrii]NKI44529.1 glyoxalase [Streptomyces physcomitrii]
MTPTFDVVGLVASDLSATLAFYRRLGLGIPDGAESAPHVEVELPGGMRLLFDSEEVIRSFQPDWRAPSGEGRIGLAFRCASPAEVDSQHAALVAAGAKSAKDPWDADWGQRYAVVLDPDGNGVSLYAGLDGAQG